MFLPAFADEKLTDPDEENEDVDTIIFRR